MSNGVINIRESDIQAIANHLAKSSSDVSMCSSDISSGIKSFTKVGLFSNGAAQLSKQMNTISSGISRLGNTVIKQYDEMANAESSLKVKAEAINIPRDFVTNDASQDINMKSGNLEKEDGKGVNAKDNTKEEKLNFEECINYNDKLKDIVKAYEEKNGEIEIKGHKTNISNISKSEVLEMVEDIEDTIIEKQIITDINSKFMLKENSIDMSGLNLNKVSLTAMDFGSLKNAIYDDKYIVVKKDLRRPE